MRLPSGRRLFAALLVAVPVASTAAPNQAPAAQAGALNDEASRSLVASAVERARAQDCRGVQALIEPALPRLSPRYRVPAQLLRVPCLADAGREAEVATIYRELVATDPRSPSVRSLGVLVAAAGGDFVEAGTRLASLAEESPNSLRGIPSTVARGIAQGLTQSAQLRVRDRMFVALARADWEPSDRPDMRDTVALGAIEALMTRKADEEARMLLPRVTAPELLAGMAMERHYEPIWPAIEARLGSASAAAVDRFAIARLEAFTRTPDDAHSLRDAVRAFILLGRPDDAIEIAERVPVAEGMSEDGAAIVRFRAQALASSGRRDAALALLGGFARLDPVKTPAAASGLVALAELLDEAGRPSEALATARAALASSQAALSPWGRGWLKRTEVCALGALGRTAEAAPLAIALEGSAGDNEAAAIEGLLCLGKMDAAAGIAVRTLATAEGANKLSDQFQPADVFWAAAPSRLRALWVPLLARADVGVAFEKSARILPERLRPARAPRPIPRRAAADNDVPLT